MGSIVQSVACLTADPGGVRGGGLNPPNVDIEHEIIFMAILPLLLTVLLAKVCAQVLVNLSEDCLPRKNLSRLTYNEP